MPTLSPTKPGTQKLSEVAKKLVIPEGIVATGWPAVRNECRRFGVEFDPWQDSAGRVILGKRADGKLAVMVGGVGMSLPRQVGKTYLVAAMIFALCILRPGLLVIWSAHHARTHGETFLWMQSFAKRAKVAPHVLQVFTGSGDEEIRFRNGARILFGARERGFGRGVPGVDVIVSDEAQIMSDRALDAQLATMNTSQFGLALFVGTPPRPEDPSEAFTRMRSDAWAGTLEDAAWIELGAEDDAKPEDRKQWAKANPSFPHRTPPESMLRLQRKLAPESFLREGLGVWDAAAASVLFDMTKWAKLGEVPREDQRPSPVAFAVAGSQDRQWFHIGLAGLRADGKRHLQVIRSFRNSSDVIDALAGADGIEKPGLIAEWKPVRVAVNPSGPAGSLIADLQAKKIEPLLVQGRDEGQAVGMFRDGFDDGTICHQGQQVLGMAVEHAQLKDSGQSKVWDYRGDIDVAPLQAVTAALFALSTVKPKKAGTFRGSGRRGR